MVGISPVRELCAGSELNGVGFNSAELCEYGRRDESFFV